jgi:hypothetical protein
MLLVVWVWLPGLSGFPMGPGVAVGLLLAGITLLGVASVLAVFACGSLAGVLSRGLVALLLIAITSPLIGRLGENCFSFVPTPLWIGPIVLEGVVAACTFLALWRIIRARRVVPPRLSEEPRESAASAADESLS